MFCFNRPVPIVGFDRLASYREGMRILEAAIQAYMQKNWKSDFFVSVRAEQVLVNTPSVVLQGHAGVVPCVVVRVDKDHQICREMLLASVPIVRKARDFGITVMVEALTDPEILD